MNEMVKKQLCSQTHNERFHDQLHAEGVRYGFVHARDQMAECLTKIIDQMEKDAHAMPYRFIYWSNGDYGYLIKNGNEYLSAPSDGPKVMEFSLEQMKAIRSMIGRM